MSQWVTRPIESIRGNPDNPRIIKDERFRRLVESVRNFPQMLELRPIVVNADGIILGGNMRHQAAITAGLTEIPVVVADQLTPDQQREFVIKDNVSAGEWNWDTLANDWSLPDLGNWGLSEVDVFAHAEVKHLHATSESIEPIAADGDIQNSIKQIVLHYDKQTYDDVLHRLSLAAEAMDIHDDHASVVLELLQFWSKVNKLYSKA